MKKITTMPEFLNDKKNQFSSKASNIKGNGGVSELTHKLSELEKVNAEIREARRAALNLMEDAILSKEALQKSEALLARELEDTKQLQQISNRIIEEDNIEQLFEAILSSAMKIMNSDMGSIQIFVPEKEALQLIVYKSFHPKSAEIWKWVNADANSVCGVSLARKQRLIVPDIKNFELIDASSLYAFQLSEIRAVQSTPLISRSDKIIGMLSTHWKQKHQPTERQLGLIDVLARQAADLIERKTAVEGLRQSEERLRTIVESALDFAIINTNTKGIVEAWNSGAEKIFGFTAEEMIGKSADVIFTEEDQANKVPEKEMETARNNGLAEDERWHKRKDGSRFYASGVMRPVYNPELTGYVKVARDLTHQKLLEQQKDDFIAVASHELRTPVTSIKAYTELLRETIGENGSAESRQLAVKLDEQIDRLIELIRALLDTTKIAEGQLFLSPESFDLNKLAAEKIEELQHSSGKHTLKLVADKDVFIKADKKRIAEVFTNLISNAIKYSPRGGDVIITTEKKQDGVEVSIKDNGIGIPENAQPKLFGRFFRAKNTQIETYPGMGLGLYIASEIIKKHNGNMWVTSTLNKGSSFYFTLPYQ